MTTHVEEVIEQLDQAQHLLREMMLGVSSRPRDYSEICIEIQHLCRDIYNGLNSHKDVWVMCHRMCYLAKELRAYSKTSRAL
jgi:hypothetical protein